MRLVVADILTNSRLGEWHPNDITWTLGRDQVPTLAGSILAPNPATRIQRPTALYVVNPSGFIPWQGVCWGLQPSAENAELWSLAAAGLQSLLGFRSIRNDYSFDLVDQATIVSALLAEAVTGPNGAIPWTVNAPLTGRLRSHNIKGSDRKSALNYITNWADNIDGYDFDVTTNSDYENTFNLRYPRDSRHETTIHARPGREIVSWTDDWTWVANNIDGTGDDGLAYSVSDTPQSGWPRMDQSFEARGVTRMTTLIDKVQRFQTLHTAPLMTAQLLLSDGTSGANMIGEDIRLIDDAVQGRDAVFQLVGIEGGFNGQVETELWTLEQTLIQEEV